MRPLMASAVLAEEDHLSQISLLTATTNGRELGEVDKDVSRLDRLEGEMVFLRAQHRVCDSRPGANS